jgi:uncharacterized membrane protein
LPLLGSISLLCWVNSLTPVSAALFSRIVTPKVQPINEQHVSTCFTWMYSVITAQLQKDHQDESGRNYLAYSQSRNFRNYAVATHDWTDAEVAKAADCFSQLAQKAKQSEEFNLPK